MKRGLVWMVLWGLAACRGAAAEPLSVIYPRQLESDRRDTYKIALLERALEATREEFGDYELRPSASVMTETRMEALMTRGDGTALNVIFKPTTRDREQSMVPVRIPILKGLLGYRVLLIHADAQPALSQVRAVEDLRRLKAGQGLGWRDVEVFEHNGIPVVSSPDYEGLFAMLAGKRFDFFSRGITEAPGEFAERRGRYPALRIEADLLLHYPWPVYFFAMRDEAGHRLARRIGRGLDRLIASGEFDRLFDEHYAGTFRELRLGARRLIELENPLLPPETPVGRSQYWLALEDLE